MNPEGDAVASSLAMAYLLKKEKKRVWIYNRDKIPEQFSFLPNFKDIRNYLPDEHFDVGIIVDTARLELVGPEFRIFLKNNVKKTIKIDHHTTSEKFADIEVIMPDACSTGEVIYNILQRMKYKINRELADCIYTSIFTDTGGFHFPNSNINAFVIASEMVRTGVKPWIVYDALYDHQPVNTLKLLAKVLNTLDLQLNGRLASIYVTEKMLRATGTTKKDTEGLINYPRSIDGVKIAVMFREDDGKVKVSLRSKGDIDVSKIAERYGGGGHKGAAAFIYNKNIQKTKKEILKELKRYIV
jgi:phosphoesterase RecJ-like protein